MKMSLKKLLTISIISLLALNFTLSNEVIGTFLRDLVNDEKESEKKEQKKKEEAPKKEEPKKEEKKEEPKKEEPKKKEDKKEETLVKWSDTRNYFLAPVQVGNPPQTVVLSLDTGADVSWIPSNECKACVDNTSFDPKKSKSYSSSDDPYTIKDKDGNANGLAANDNISIGQYKAKGYNFVLVKNIDENYSDYKSGKLAFAYKSPNGKTFLDVLKENNQISYKLITLTNEKDQTMFYIGDYPPGIEYEQKQNISKCSITRDLDNLSEEYRNKWVCDLSKGMIGNNKDNTFDINGYAYFDSGSAVITAPKKYLEMFRAKYTKSCDESVGDSGDTMFECNKNVIDLEKIESLHLIIEGWAYEIPASILFKINIKGNSYSFSVRFNNGSDVWTIGQNFISQFMTLFNQEESTVGFYGGSKKLLDKDAGQKLNETKSIEAENKRKIKLIVTVAGAVLVVVFLILVILCLFRSFRKPAEDDRPLINS